MKTSLIFSGNLDLFSLDCDRLFVSLFSVTTLSYDMPWMLTGHGPRLDMNCVIY